MAAMIPMASANKPAVTAYLVLLIPTTPKYTATTYRVVSVLPCIVAAIFSCIEPIPKLFITSTYAPLAPPPLNGFMIATGNASTHSVTVIPMDSTSHSKLDKSNSSAPEARRSAMATSIAMR